MIFKSTWNSFLYRMQVLHVACMVDHLCASQNYILPRKQIFSNQVSKRPQILQFLPVVVELPINNSFISMINPPHLVHVACSIDYLCASQNYIIPWKQIFSNKVSKRPQILQFFPIVIELPINNSFISMINSPHLVHVACSIDYLCASQNYMLPRKSFFQ